MAKTKSSKKAYSLLVFIVAILVIVPVGIETYARKIIAKRINDYTAAFFNTKTSPQLGNGIVTLDLLKKNIKNVTIDTANPGDNDVRFDANISAIKLRSFTEPESITHLNAKVVWPTGAILNQLNQSLAQQPGQKIISSVSIDQEKQALRIELIGGFSTLIIRPVVKDTRIDFDVVSASALGMELPQEMVQNLVSALTKNIGKIPENIHVQKLDLDTNSVIATVYGDNIPLNQTEQSD